MRRQRRPRLAAVLLAAFGRVAAAPGMVGHGDVPQSAGGSRVLDAPTPYGVGENDSVLAIIPAATAKGGQTPQQEQPAPAPKPSRVASLHQLPAASGGLCLDGSPGAFALFPGDPNRWMIYLSPGGWCFTEMDCADRASDRTGEHLGGTTHLDYSSTSYDDIKAMYPFEGLLSDQWETSPSFSGMTKVVVQNCDGGGFSGDRQDPVSAVDYDGVNRTLYFRGARILDGVMKMLGDSFGLLKAEEVAFAGGSAGGFAVFMHVDRVRQELTERRAALNMPPFKRFKAISSSGFFPQLNNAVGHPVYPDNMRQVFEMQQARPNRACIDALAKAAPTFQDALNERWRCFNTQSAYAYSTTPTMVLNSIFDSWGIWYIHTGDYVSGFPQQTSCKSYSEFWVLCNGSPGTVLVSPHFDSDSMHSSEYGVAQTCPANPMACSEKQTAGINNFTGAFRQEIMSVPNTGSKGNGVFLYTCHSHLAETSSFYMTGSAENMTMRRAVEEWWNSAPDSPAELHTHVDQCSFGQGIQWPGGMCNPTCLAAMQLARGERRRPSARLSHAAQTRGAARQPKP
jgi:hypothetical protein